MPYLILAVGILLGLYGLCRFVLRASPQQTKMLLRCGGLVILGCLLLFMALTGRLAIALILFVVAVLLIFPWQRIGQDKPES